MCGLAYYVIITPFLGSASSAQTTLEKYKLVVSVAFVKEVVCLFDCELPDD